MEVPCKSTFPKTHTHAPPLPHIDSRLGPRHIIVLHDILLYTRMHDIYPIYYNIL